MSGIGTFVLWTLFQAFGPNPPIVISKETTVITSPLGEDGLTDYQAYWRDFGREGVTPENNGAVLFWRAMWPGELAPKHRQLMCDALGIQPMPVQHESLQDPYSELVRQLIAFWLTEQYQAGLSDAAANQLLSEALQKQIRDDVSNDVIGEAQTRPWRSEQIPPLADWAKSSEKPLKLLGEAAQRPKWWSPSPSTLEDHYEGSIAMLLPGVQMLRSVGRAFSIRAMWHAGEGRPEAAWQDLKTCFQFARVTSKGATLVEQLVAIAIDTLTLKQTVALLQYREPDAKFARQVLKDLMVLETPCDVIRSFDLGDRIFYADTVLMLTYNPDILRDFGFDEAAQVMSATERLGYLSVAKIDWNFILREGNAWYDRLRDAGKKPTYQERRAAFAEIENDLKQLSERAITPGRVVAGMLSCDARSAILSDVMVSLMLPALDAATKAQDRAVAILDLTRVAAALAVYRAEQGKYPEKLEQLVPSVLATVPDDLYTGKPFIYERKTDGGYLLYSVYENETDEGGTNGDDIWAGEWMKVDPAGTTQMLDLVIRVPVPEFKMPAPPQIEN